MHKQETGGKKETGSRKSGLEENSEKEKIAGRLFFCLLRTASVSEHPGFVEQMRIIKCCTRRAPIIPRILIYLITL